jgi:hypothetical protein
MANGGSFLGAVVTVAVGTIVGIWAYKKIDRVEDRIFRDR